ncbi:MAG: carbonate dehydratase [Planctomycetales bacterium]|nr:carbonate dehydratase [Planctomycetales bacterium]
MRSLTELISNNVQWSEEMARANPGFFDRLAKQQTPDYLWIGCSDSRVPANQIVDLDPGELFVHRNVANLVVHTDFNCLSVIQYAVEALNVKHIIVCGHYSCGGVKAALCNFELGLIDNWLRHIQDVQEKHAKMLSMIEDTDERCNRLCELNVIEQVINVCGTTIVRDAWRRGDSLTIHGWIYGLKDGRILDLAMGITGSHEVDAAYAATVSNIASGTISKTKTV